MMQARAPNLDQTQSGQHSFVERRTLAQPPPTGGLLTRGPSRQAGAQTGAGAVAEARHAARDTHVVTFESTVFWIDRFHPHSVKQNTAFAATLAGPQ
jgi:hypothetical protein